MWEGLVKQNKEETNEVRGQCLCPLMHLAKKARKGKKKIKVWKECQIPAQATELP